MATTSPESDLSRFQKASLTAFVVGYTGATGLRLVRLLDQVKIFRRVVLIGRRQIALDVGPEFEQKQVDFEQLEESKEVFQGADVGFCLLGTTRGKAGRDGFIRVDRDYCLAVAQIAREQGCQHYVLMSSGWADAKTSNLYLRIKGEVEEETQKMSFDRLSIHRPRYLIGKREDCRPSGVFFGCIFKPIACCCPTALSVTMETVAKAMIVDVITPATEGSRSRIFENRAIHELGKDFPDQ